jgi:hypothetical protein
MERREKPLIEESMTRTTLTGLFTYFFFYYLYYSEHTHTRVEQ